MSENMWQEMTLERITDLRSRTVGKSYINWPCNIVSQVLDLAERALRAADPAPAREPEIVARPDHHPLDKLYADPQFQKEYHEELARERAAEPEPAVSEARVCLKCGRTEVGWRYNRCPNCGEMADDPAPAEGAPQSWEAVCRDVLAERVAQDQQWGGSTHDDNHRPDEWCLYIDKQRRLARDADDPRAYESRLIKIAALAVAAIQSSRRLNQPKAPDPTPAPAPVTPQRIREIVTDCVNTLVGLGVSKTLAESPRQFSELLLLADWMEQKQ